MITVYTFDNRNILKGSQELNERQPMPVRSTLKAPPELSQGEFALFNGNSWEVVNQYPEPPPAPAPEPEPVPYRITKGQARRQLIKMGVMPSDVQAIIDQIADTTERAIAQSYWDDEQYYLRDHPIMLQIGVAMGFTETQMDDAFREAVK